MTRTANALDRSQPAAVVRHIHSASSKEWSPLFTFHVDRNRMLMLTKNARAGLALREVLRYPLTTASLLARGFAQARHTHAQREDLADFVVESLDADFELKRASGKFCDYFAQRIRQTIGHLGSQDMARLGIALAFVLGLAD